MKKILIALLVLLVIVLTCAYKLIPRHLNVSHQITAETGDRWAFKYLSQESEWKHWWPTDSVHTTATGTALEYGGLSFHLDSLYYNALTIKIVSGDDTVNSKMIIIPVKADEVHLVWTTDLDGTNNPVKRWRTYKHGVDIKAGMERILAAYKAWLGKPSNVYGFDIKEGRIIDTLLITIRVFFDHDPGAGEVDSVMKKLRGYVSGNGAKVIGYPMLNVINDSADIYNTQFALPIDKEIPQTEVYRIKRMFPGKALVTKIKGGPATIARAYEANDAYKHDYSRISPAVPFQSIITDRIAEPDTSKWETILYYPVK